MRNKAGIVCMIIGVVLIFSALLLILNNVKENEQAGKSRDTVMMLLEQEIDKDEKDNWNDTDNMSLVEIDGYSYIGYLSIPVLELELPVMADWDYERLKVAPCRQCGTIENNNLVIAGHNYEQHFGRLSSLELGDWVWFTDAKGVLNTYTVAAIEILDADQVDEMKNSEWDLSLYTCTPGGRQRLTIRCERYEMK